MKKLLSMVVIFCMVFILGACGSKEAGSEANGNTEDEKAKIKIEELNYQVNVEVDNGERYVMNEILTNNSKYVITNFELTYKVKKDVTNEQKNKFYDEIQKNFKFNEEDVNELKQKEISMHAETNRLIDAGQTVDKINCYYFGGSYYLKDINHLKLCEPDIATIKYIDDGKIHTMYYDYANDSYSYDDGNNTFKSVDQKGQLGKKYQNLILNALLLIQMKMMSSSLKHMDSQSMNLMNM